MVLLTFHEQLISGIFLGKGLLLVLMFLELGPVYRIFMLPFKIIFVGGECIVHKVGRVGGEVKEMGVPTVVGTQHWSGLCLFTIIHIEHFGELGRQSLILSSATNSLLSGWPAFNSQRTSSWPWSTGDLSPSPSVSLRQSALMLPIGASPQKTGCSHSGDPSPGFGKAVSLPGFATSLTRYLQTCIRNWDH